MERLRENITTLIWNDNPGFPKVGPAIEGPWLWVVLPNTKLDSSTDLLSEASGGTVTETEIATHGAIEGSLSVMTCGPPANFRPTGWGNIDEMLQDAIEGVALRHCVPAFTKEQDTTIYVGSHYGFKVWLNGVLIYESLHYHASHGYTDFLPVTLKPGRNVLLVVTN